MSNLFVTSQKETKLSSLLNALKMRYGSSSAQPQESAETQRPSQKILKFSDITLAPDVREALLRVMQEQKNKEMLTQHNLAPLRKILLYGPIGVGKAMSAATLSSELNLPLKIISLENLRQGGYFGLLGMEDVLDKLAKIFKDMQTLRAVYFFSGFGTQEVADSDFLPLPSDQKSEEPSDESIDNFSSALNNLLHFIQEDKSEAIIIVTINTPKMLDKTVLQYFDCFVRYDIPTKDEISSMIQSVAAHSGISDSLLGSMVDQDVLSQISKHLVGKNQATIVRVCEDAVKDLLLCGEEFGWVNYLALLRQRIALEKNKQAKK